MFMKYFYVLAGLLILMSAQGQNTVGLLSYKPSQSYDGYNLIYPHNQSSVYLIDNCGEIVHEWADDDNWRPGNTACLTEDGLLYKTKRDATVTSDDIWAGGGGAILEIRDWDNNLVWDFQMNDSINRLHHDFAVTEDGNIIALAWELKTTEECIAAGRDTSTLAQKVMWPDWIFEIDPTTDEIVWEWHTWDHLVQDFDSSKANYGIIAEEADRIDVNFGRVDGHPDWMHGNSLDYNEDIGQLLLSVPYFNEIWIIDKTTTTSEAAGSFGGFSNKGGDLMYRWGNPLTYGQGDSTDQKFFFQHDSHWVDDHLETTHPHFGKIAVFNNRFADDYSVVSLIRPQWSMYEWRYETEQGKFLPESYDLNLTHPDLTSLFSTGLSSAQFLPNGNALILGGRFGYSFEMTPDDDIVWEYVTPWKGTQSATQGDSLTVNQNLTFRIHRYPSDYRAFNGKDLSSKGWIELSPDIEFCDNILPVTEAIIDETYRLFPNPVAQTLTVEWDGMMKADIEIYDSVGRLRYAESGISGGRKYVDVSALLSGIYYLSIDGAYVRKFVVGK